MLVTWGGPSDTYGGFDFHGASLTFLDLLTDDGHVAVACEHDAGHLPPVEATDMLVTFFGDHRRGLVALWPEGLPADLPEWCTWP